MVSFCIVLSVVLILFSLVVSRFVFDSLDSLREDVERLQSAVYYLAGIVDYLKTPDEKPAVVESETVSVWCENCSCVE